MLRSLLCIACTSMRILLWRVVRITKQQIIPSNEILTTFLLLQSFTIVQILYFDDTDVNWERDMNLIYSPCTCTHLHDTLHFVASARLRSWNNFPFVFLPGTMTASYFPSSHQPNLSSSLSSAPSHQPSQSPYCQPLLGFNPVWVHLCPVHHHISLFNNQNCPVSRRTNLVINLHCLVYDRG